MYSINFTTLIANLLPHFLRKDKMLAWLYSLLSPARYLFAEFLLYRDKKLYEARITGQVNSLEWMLNDKFYSDGGLRNIYIHDADFEEEIYIYNTYELEAKTYLFNTSESAEDNLCVYNAAEAIGSANFIVYVPVLLAFDIDYMTSLLNKFKLAGPTFEIKIY